jgi:cobalt-zinc-cadmium efflux system protein
LGVALAAGRGVAEVHDLHVWEVTTGMPAVSAHIIVKPEADCHQARFRASALLDERFGVEHSTLQVEHHHDEGELLEIER